jgi:hypothetical protein
MLNESNKRYAFYTTEFKDNPLVAPRKGVSYDGSAHFVNGQTNMYIVSGVFPDGSKSLRISIPSDAKGKEVKSTKDAEDLKKYCLSRTNECAVADVICTSVSPGCSRVSINPWSPGIYDYIEPSYRSEKPREITSEELVVYGNVYAGVSGVLYNRPRDGEMVFLPLESKIGWERRSRFNLFMRRSAYLITVPVDVVLTPFYLLVFMTIGAG